MTFDEYREGLEDRLEKRPRQEKIYWFQCRHCSDIKYGIRDLYYRIRWGYVPSEVWGFNSWAVETLLPNFRRFVESQRPGGGAIGCPADMYDNDAKDGDHCHKWREELEEILWCFEWYKKNEIDCNTAPYIPEKYLEDSKRAYAGFEKFGRALMGMWD